MKSIHGSIVLPQKNQRSFQPPRTKLEFRSIWPWPYRRFFFFCHIKTISNVDIFFPQLARDSPPGWHLIFTFSHVTRSNAFQRKKKIQHIETKTNFSHFQNEPKEIGEWRGGWLSCFRFFHPPSASPLRVATVWLVCDNFDAKKKTKNSRAKVEELSGGIPSEGDVWQAVIAKQPPAPILMRK